MIVISPHTIRISQFLCEVVPLRTIEASQPTGLPVRIVYPVTDIKHLNLPNIDQLGCDPGQLVDVCHVALTGNRVIVDPDQVTLPSFVLKGLNSNLIAVVLPYVPQPS